MRDGINAGRSGHRLRPGPMSVPRSRTMRICIFSRSFAPVIGGLERLAELIARYIAEQGHPVEVVTDVAAEPGDDVGLPYVVTRTTSFRERLRSIARSDVVLFMNMSLVGIVRTLVLGKRIVASHHGGYQGIGLRGFILEGAKRTVTRFVTNISCSNYIAGQIPGHSIVVPNAYDDRLFRPRDVAQRSLDFAFCGRLVSDKGVDLLIRAFARVTAAVADTHLTIVGDGPERDALAQMATSLGVLDRIRFVGALRNEALVEELKKHRCMVVPSVWEEPFGIVALEGVACCDTIIVTNRGGLPEAVGPCGIVVEPTVESLAAAMLNVATARAKGRTLPQRPTEDVRMAHLSAHRPEVVAARYLEVVEVAYRGRH